MSKVIRGAGGGGGGGGGRRGGGNQAPAPVVQQTTIVQAPAPRTPTFTDDDPGLRSVSFAQIQFLLAEGEVEGPAEGNTREGLLQSVRLDDTPIQVGTADPSPKPEDLVFSYGRVAGEQSAVPGYFRIGDVISVDKEVNKDVPIGQAVSVSANSGEYAGKVLLTFQALVYQSGNGDVLPTSVEYKISYTDNAGTERVVFDDKVEGKFSGQFQRQHDFDFEGSGPWNVVVERKTEDDDQRTSGANVYSTQFNYSSVAASLKQGLHYPQSSMLTVGIRADIYAGLPAVSIDLKGLKVQIPSNYDPEKREYTGTWDGTFKADTAWTNNPAWILRDLIVNDRYGLGEYISEDLVDKWTLYQIAEYCDEEVDAMGGGKEPRFTANIVLQTAEEAWNVLQQISSVFRGLLYYSASMVVSGQDRPSTPVFTFNESNTIQNVSADGKVETGNFIYVGAAKRARHTVCLVSWDEPNNNYQPRVEYIADEESLNRFGYKPMDLRMLGCTSRGQALRAARWALYSERELDDTITFRTNEIGMALRPGDVVKIADPLKAAGRYGGRVTAVSGNTITVDQMPPTPTTWAGSTFQYMVNGTNNEPQIISRNIGSVDIDARTITLAATSHGDPVINNPWIVEVPDRSAQLFRVLSVEEQDGGVYAVSALRYEEDIYDSVDNDTPLNPDDDYLFKPVAPEKPTITTHTLVWDNNQAKMNLAWKPGQVNNILNGFDLTIRGYRVQYQAGTYDEDTDTTTYEDTWREILFQVDTREQVPIDQYVVANRYKVRVLSVGRTGQESPWSDVVTIGPITDYIPFPDLGGDDGGDPATDNATLMHMNQSSGSQLFSWNFNVDIPPYVNAVRLECKPSRDLTDVEERGLREPNADGWYLIADIPTNDYYAVAFHALVNWEVRLSLRTLIPDLQGDTYVTDTVDVQELYPPIPDLFTVVTEPIKANTPLTRRFSWEFTTDPPFVENWPLRVVNDISAFEIRFKAGTNVDWDLGWPLYADGVPGDQRWFETTLFDSGTWTVMIRPRDRTGWLSEDTQFVLVNLGDALPTNVVEERDLKDECFPGTYDNIQLISGGVNYDTLMYPAPITDPFYEQPYSDEIYQGAPCLVYETPTTDPFYKDPTSDVFYECGEEGCNLELIDPSKPGEYIFPHSIVHNGGGIVVFTKSTGTYQWFIRHVPTDDADLIYKDPTTDPFYETPLTDLFYRSTSADIDGEFHPLAPFEKLNAGIYELGVRLKSIDGTDKAQINDVDVIIDYPDLFEVVDDFQVPSGGGRFTLKQTFRHVGSVNLTLQAQAGSDAITARLDQKDLTGFNVSCLDKDGNTTNGLIDAIVAGY
jgi:hypothetical protein